MICILQPDLSLLLLVNIQGSLHCTQGSLQENIILQLPVVYGKYYPPVTIETS